jgi:large repetitive protein
MTVITSSALPASLSRIALAYRPQPPADNQTLHVVTTLLPAGALGTSYSATIITVGGTSPYTYSLVSGTLPSGIALNASTGVLSGTPAAAGTSTFTVRSTDIHGLFADQAFGLVVGAAGGGGGGVTGWIG